MNPTPPDTPALSPIRTMSRSSPSRVSIDSQSQTHTHPPSSPFFHNLTQRLRKGSNASSHSGEHPAPPLPSHDPMTKTEATRAARRMLFSMVKDDWEYPSTTVRHSDTDLPPREPIAYRLREESQSDIEAEELYFRRTHRSRSDPYKFESPDDVGNFVAERLRRRRRLLEEEMKWNEGLRTWTLRRDAWTGAVKHKPIMDEPNTKPGAGTSTSLNGGSSSSTKRPPHKSRLSHSIFPSHNHNTSNSANTSPNRSPDSPHSNKNSNPSSPSEALSVDSNVDSTDATPSATAGDPAIGPWIPIYPPILSQEDVLRDRIKPHAYPTIYSKVVVQSMTPNVPIPLKHMIPALVEGWKAEGNWPPQPAAMAAQETKKGRRSSAFAKWRREHHFDTKAAEHTVVNEDGKSRVRRSIGMMRKVLGGVHGDGGLEELGIEFREQDEDEMQKNVTLNDSLLGVEHGDGDGHGGGNGGGNA